MIASYYCPKCMEGFIYDFDVETVVSEDMTCEDCGQAFHLSIRTETIVETSMKPKEPRHD